jgi:hypothetical protein
MNCDALIAVIAKVHTQLLPGAAGPVTSHLILRNWMIGAYLVEFEQNRADRGRYGTGFLRKPSADLRKQEIPGASQDMLRLTHFRRPCEIALNFGGVVWAFDAAMGQKLFKFLSSHPGPFD